MASCLVLVNYSTNQFWVPSLSDWSSIPFNISHTLNAGQLVLENLSEPVRNLDSAYIGIMTDYTGEAPTYYYSDYAPIMPMGNEGIPGFHLVFLLLSVPILLGVIFLQHRNKKQTY